MYVMFKTVVVVTGCSVRVTGPTSSCALCAVILETSYKWKVSYYFVNKHSIHMLVNKHPMRLACENVGVFSMIQGLRFSLHEMGWLKLKSSSESV